MVDKAQYFRSLEERYGLPEGYLSRTEAIESQGNIRAYNKNSGAAGPFQFIPKSQKEFNLKDPYSLEESADAAARMAARNKVSLQRQGIENPTAADLYAAHQQGAKGYVDLLKAGDQPASKVVGEEAVVWNGGKPDMKASEFAGKITSKFSGEPPSQPKPPEQTATGVLANRKADVAETPEQVAALEEQQAALSTQDVLDTANAASDGGRRLPGDLRSLGFLHNYFKSLDVSATGVKPLAAPDFFHQPKYAVGGIVSLKKDAEKVRAAGIGGDTVLAHITASEAALLKSLGGSGRINPRTGLPMFDEGEGRGDPEGGSSSPEGPSTGESPGPGGGGMRDSNTTDSSGNTGGNAGAGPGDKGESADKGDKGPGDKGEQGDKEGASRGSVQDSQEAVSPSISSPEIATKNDITSSFNNDKERAPGFDIANTRSAIENALAGLIEAPAALAFGPNELQSIGNTKSSSMTVDRDVSLSPEAEKAKQEAIALEALALMNREEMAKQSAFAAVTSTPTTTTPEEVEAATSKANQAAREMAIANALAGLVEAPAAIGVNPSTAVSPSTSTPSATPNSTPSSTTSQTNPTANSSTTKGKGYDITGWDFLDSKISAAINNPTATLAGIGLSVANPALGIANTVAGNPFGMGVDRAVSSVTGTSPGQGNTATSQDPGTSPSTPSGPGPSVSDTGPMGSSSGETSTTNPVSPSTTSSTTSGTTAPVSYDVSNFLSNLGKSSYTAPASVYSAYPVQQGIGSIAAPQYTGSFYNPNFGKVPYL